MNTELLQRVKQHILEEPLRIEMIQGLAFYTPGTRRPLAFTPAYAEVEVPACGTVGCIAGWACRVADPNWDDTTWESVRNQAQALLGLSYWQGEKLFYLSGWELESMHRYTHAQTPQERAQATADRIDRFIDTMGAK